MSSYKGVTIQIIMWILLLMILYILIRIIYYNSLFMCVQICYQLLKRTIKKNFWYVGGTKVSIYDLMCKIPKPFTISPLLTASLKTN